MGGIEFGNLILPLVQKFKGLGISKVHLKSKRVGGGTSLDFRSYYKATRITTVWSWRSQQPVGQKGVEKWAGTCTSTCFLTRAPKQYKAKSKVFSAYADVRTGHPPCMKRDSSPYCSLQTKINLRWITSLNIKVITISF